MNWLLFWQSSFNQIIISYMIWWKAKRDKKMNRQEDQAQQKIRLQFKLFNAIQLQFHFRRFCVYKATESGWLIKNSNSMDCPSKKINAIQWHKSQSRQFTSTNSALFCSLFLLIENQTECCVYGKTVRCNFQLASLFMFSFLRLLFPRLIFILSIFVRARYCKTTRRLNLQQ